MKIHLEFETKRKEDMKFLKSLQKAIDRYSQELKTHE